MQTVDEVEENVRLSKYIEKLTLAQKKQIAQLKQELDKCDFLHTTIANYQPF